MPQNNAIVNTEIGKLLSKFPQGAEFERTHICGREVAEYAKVNTLASELLFAEVRRRCLSILSLQDIEQSDQTPMKNAVLLDICCGTGTIGLCLASLFEKVIGIELVPAAIENAVKNAKLNGISNAKFFVGKAESLLSNVILTIPRDKTIIAILDPPRAGVHPGAIEAIRQCDRIQRLIFVACDLQAAIPNFVSFARPPSKKYVGNPFLPTVASCVDLFPQTSQIEVVVSLKRLSATDCDPSGCS